MEEDKMIQSIPGIGEKIAATIISKIEEMDRLNHPIKLGLSQELTLVSLNLVHSIVL